MSFKSNDLGIVWFRNDLRVLDNKALYHALDHHSKGVLAVFCICEQQWKSHGVGLPKINFMIRQLVDLQRSLKELNVNLMVFDSEDFNKSIKDVLKFAITSNVKRVYYNKEIEYNERKRDRVFDERAKLEGLEISSFQDSCILSPQSLKTQQGTPYKVFTPFKKNWLATVEKNGIITLPKPKKLDSAIGKVKNIQTYVNRFKLENAYWKVGEKFALAQLENFISKDVESYHLNRDFPSLNNTSHLSPYLASGVLSARVCYSKVQKVLGLNKNCAEGVLTWCSEIIWREFYRHLLVDFPRLSRGRAFKLSTESLNWRRNDADLEKWKEGRTGIPIIDASMRQLKEINWMHNRLRMVVSMFLTKNLRMHWSLGEEHFSKNLVDYDLAANNGGWQWSASTGCDAVPYFRVFNPISQSIRFDKNADFIKEYVPELRNIPNKDCHEPFSKRISIQGLDYPKPLVDLKMSRLKAIEMFKKGS